MRKASLTGEMIIWCILPKRIRDSYLAFKKQNINT